MIRLFFVLFVICLSGSILAQSNRTLPFFSPGSECESDWLVNRSNSKAGAFLSLDERDIILWNGLARRTFRIGANLACYDYRNLCSGEQLLRAVKPEARIVLNGKSYNIGGLYGQKQQGYLLPEWVDALAGKPEDFQLASWEVKKISPRINWKRNRWASNQMDATGVELVFQFEHASASLEGLKVFVHYELYDYLPLICKWVTITNENSSGKSFVVDKIVNEILAAHEEESAVVGHPDRMKKPHGIYIESNYCFNNAMRAELSDQSTHWIIDSSYTSQVNYDYNTPCVLEVFPGVGPGVVLGGGETMESLRTWELLLDSYDRERSGLARRRMYRTITPWATQNP
ncbi:MAG: alpha-galactosidase, partial [Bacteroidota bacterium]